MVDKLEENPPPPSGAPVSTPTFVYVLLVLVVILIVVIIVIAMVLRDPAFNCPSKSAKSRYHVKMMTTTETPHFAAATPVIPLTVDAMSYRNTHTAFPSAMASTTTAPRMLGDEKQKIEENSSYEYDEPQTNRMNIMAVEMLHHDRKMIIVGHGFVENMIVLWDNRIQYPYKRISSEVIWVDATSAPLAVIHHSSTSSTRSNRVQGLPSSLYDAWKTMPSKNRLRIIRPQSDSCVFSETRTVAPYLSFDCKKPLTVMVREANSGKLLTRSVGNSLSLILSTFDRQEKETTTTTTETTTIHAGIGIFSSSSSSSSSNSTKYYHVRTASISGLEDVFSYEFYNSSSSSSSLPSSF